MRWMTTIPSPHDPYPPLNYSDILGASRRDVLTRSLGAAGVLGVLQLVNAKEARAEDLHNLPLTGGRIDPALLTALDFERQESMDPGAVFDPDTGLLVGFGHNLFHYDPSTKTSRLFDGGLELFKSSVTENVAENIPAFTAVRLSTGRLSLKT